MIIVTTVIAARWQAESCYVNQADLELEILLLQLPEQLGCQAIIIIPKASTVVEISCAMFSELNKKSLGSILAIFTETL